jgi:hypothetical protein
MTDPLRYTILAQLETAMEGISVAGGYNLNADTVEILARGYDDPMVPPAAVPWIGIVPGDETITPELNGQEMSEWSISLICHFAFTTRTDKGLALACAQAAHDLRHAIGANPTLGLEEVLQVKIVRRQGSEGSVEAVRIGRGSVMLTIAVQFLEQIDAA